MKVKTDKNQPKKPPDGFPQTFDELYKLCVDFLIHGNKQQVNKMWKLINSNEECWIWIRAKIITDAYSSADAKGKENFCLIGIEKHIKSKNAKFLKDEFSDPETGIKYRQYLFRDGLIYRIPFATKDMDKYAYQKALNKKFLGDFIELHAAGKNKTTLIPLDTEEKVRDYNNGVFFKNHYYKKGQRKLDNADSISSNKYIK